MICDLRKNFGIYSDGCKVWEIRIDKTKSLLFTQGRRRRDMHPEEKICQALWHQYCCAVNIPEQKNPKLHVQCLPRRYWKYLPEKRRANFG
jgi:probable DNA metabolism protein